MRKMGRIILAVVMIAALLAMMAGIHVQAGHTCAGECCPICPVIERTLSVLSGMAPAMTKVCVLIACALAAGLEASDAEKQTARTLVTMKCELRD